MRVPRLIAITAPDAPLDIRFERWLADLARAGVDAAQVRRKEVGDRELLALVERARDALAGTSVTLLVNGRADIALAASPAPGVDAAGAIGVHLPSEGLPSAEVRRLLAGAGRHALVGRSTHRLDEIAHELRSGPDGADYVTYGPVHPTPFKAPYGEPAGLDGPGGLRAAHAVGLPVVALGGVSPERVPGIAAAGAAGVAAIRACRDRASIEEIAAAVRESFPRQAAGPEG